MQQEPSEVLTLCLLCLLSGWPWWIQTSLLQDPPPSRPLR